MTPFVGDRIWWPWKPKQVADRSARYSCSALDVDIDTARVPTVTTVLDEQIDQQLLGQRHMGGAGCGINSSRKLSFDGRHDECDIGPASAAADAHNEVIASTFAPLAFAARMASSVARLAPEPENATHADPAPNWRAEICCAIAVHSATG